MASSADADREERFKHLLQPIRDLAQNWDVDIATSLEDYLEDLEDITITLDGGASNVNFAEAALLIQGSTCVYSRKVEHVHQLVLRTIDFLTQQKQQQQNRGGGGDGSKGDDGGDDVSGEGDDVMFLSLDDMLDEGKHIDLEKPSRRGRNRRRSSSMATSTTNGFFDGERGVARCGDRDKDGERDSLFGAGRVSEISRPPMFLMEQDYGNSFKMSTCAVDPSGALLIEGAKLDAVGASGSSFSRSGISAAAGGASASTCCDFWGGVGRDGELGREASPEPGGFVGGYEDDGDSDGGDGAGDFGGGNEPGEEYEEGEGEGGRRQGLRTPTAEGRELRPRPPKAKTADATPAGTGASSRKIDDPWRLLDPHDPGTSQARPIRRGRTYRLPPQLRRRRSAEGDKDEGCDGSRSSWVALDGTLAVSVPMQGLAYPEFQYVAKRERQRKAIQARLARRQAREFMGREHLLAESTTITSGISASLLGDGEGDAPDYDGYGSEGGCSSDSGGGGGGGFGDYGDLSEGEGDGPYGAGGIGPDERVAPISLEDAFRDKPQTYEDLCRSHIEAFMRGTEKYAHETQLSKRVGAWQDKLEPLMRRQEKRQAFDIHKYGNSVLTKVASMLGPSERARALKAKKTAMRHENADQTTDDRSREGDGDKEPDLSLVDFGAVVDGKERFDVCRLFLASLQLANNGNVRLFHGVNAADQDSTPFRLELLSLQETDNMSGYFAPSVSQVQVDEQHQHDDCSAPPAPDADHAAAAGTGIENADVAVVPKRSKASVKSGRRKGGRSRRSSSSTVGAVVTVA